MTTTRRTSARLSGETAPTAGEGGTLAPRRTSNGRAAGKSAVPSTSASAEGATKGRKRASGGTAVAELEGAVEPAGGDRGKKRKVATVEMFAKPTTGRRAKPAAFEPIAIGSSQPKGKPSDVSLPINASGLAPSPPPAAASGSQPPPPRPSERKIARRRSSSRALVDREASNSPPLVPLDYGKKTGPAGKAKGKTASKSAVNGLGAGPMEVVNGLDGEGLSLQEELGQERGKWSGMVEERRGDLRATTSAAMSAMPDLSMLTFGTATSADVPRAASPPPNPADYRLHTPARPGVSRRRSMAPSHALDAYVPDKEVSRRTAAALSGATASGRDGLVEIPVTDTPMIRKNREMRKDNERRRSSLNMRGNRLSESLTRGEMMTPHPGVPADSLYKHLNQALPEPVKLRHLMLCIVDRVNEPPAPSKSGKSSGKRKVRDKKLPYEPTEQGEAITRNVMKELQEMLMAGKVDTNIIAPTNAKPVTGELKAHPANVANKKAFQHAQEIIAACRAEAPKWQAELDRQNDRLTWFTQKQRKQLQAIPPDVREQPVWAGEGEMIDQLKGWERLAASVLGNDAEVGRVDAAHVEYQVDAIHQASHSAVQYTTQAGRVMDGIFASLAADLRTRDNAGLPAPSSTNGTGRAAPSRDPRDLLRALAATEADQQSAATVMAASSLPPVSRQAHPAATPRRAPGTPRRAGGLGSTMTPSRRAQQE